MTAQPTERHADGLALNAQLVHGLGHQAVDDAVGAAGTVVERRVGEGLRFFKHNGHVIRVHFHA